jgi:hypothetical protein
MKIATITMDRLNSPSDNFRVQVHPPLPALFGPVYNFLYQLDAEKAGRLRDSAGSQLQTAMVEVVKANDSLLPLLRSFVNNDEYVDPDCRQLVVGALHAAGIAV